MGAGKEASAEAEGCSPRNSLHLGLAKQGVLTKASVVLFQKFPIHRVGAADSCIIDVTWTVDGWE